MKLQQLFDDDGRLETRTVDDPDQGSMATGDDFPSNGEENPDGEENPNGDSFQDGFDDGTEENQPDFGDVEEPDAPVVDDQLWSQVSSNDYVTDFEHSANQSIHPRVIAALDAPNLKKLQGRIEDMISRHEMDKGKVGLYNDTTYKYLTSLQSFVLQVLETKTEKS